MIKPIGIIRPNAGLEIYVTVIVEIIVIKRVKTNCIAEN